MGHDLTGRTIAFLVANEGIEQVELTEPWKAVTEAGATARLLAPETGRVQAFNHLDKADTFDVDVAVADAAVADYDGLVTSRNPDDLPAFNAKITEEFAEGTHEVQGASV